MTHPIVERLRSNPDGHEAAAAIEQLYEALERIASLTDEQVKAGFRPQSIAFYALVKARSEL